MKKDLLSECELERTDYESIFEGAYRLKRMLREGKDHTRYQRPDRSPHLCRLLSDLFTIIEKRRAYQELKVACVGDGNNMAISWNNAAAKLPFHLDLACPEGYDPDKAILKRGMARAPCRDRSPPGAGGGRS